jgi:colanic acid biosynthesis glycosyl transferase WcaI
MPQTRPATALVVTQHYWPEPIGSAPYCTDMVERLAGHADVTVFTCTPHYPAGDATAGETSAQAGAAQRGGAIVMRVAAPRAARRGVAGRIAADTAYFCQGVFALVRRRIRRADVVVSLCPSILTVLLGVLVKRRAGRHVAVVHDIPSGLAGGLGMVGSARLVAAMRRIESAILNRADAVLVLSQNMRRRLEAQGVKRPIEILPIWVDTESICPMDRPPDQVTTVLYSGNFGRKQALGQVIDMAERLERRGVAVDVVLRGAGSEAKALADEVAARGLSFVRFAPLVGAECLAETLAQGDIHLVPQAPNAADFSVPSKVFSIMAAGRPFVAAAPSGSLLWDLKSQSRAFLCVPAGDGAALSEAVQRLVRDPILRAELGLNGRRYVTLHHDKARILERFVSIVRDFDADQTCQTSVRIS